jgi:hypothetical protein
VASLVPARGGSRFEIRNPLLQLLDPCAGTRKQLLLDIEFLTRYEFEAAQSLSQYIAEICMQIVTSLSKSRRDQRCEALGQLVDTSRIHGESPRIRSLSLGKPFPG